MVKKKDPNHATKACPKKPNAQVPYHFYWHGKGVQRRFYVGLVLLSLGVTLFFSSFLIATKTDTVIDTSFVLEPSEEYETYYHTRVITISSLTGEVVVEGVGVYLTAYGYNTKHLRNVFVNQNLSFTINSAHDLYTFTFENTGGNLQSSVKFTLEEKWLNFSMLIPGFIGLMISVPAGTVLIVAGLRKKTKEKERIH
jgi:hypothetical protein